MDGVQAVFPRKVSVALNKGNISQESQEAEGICSPPEGLKLSSAGRRSCRWQRPNKDTRSWRLPPPPYPTPPHRTTPSSVMQLSLSLSWTVKWISWEPVSTLSQLGHPQTPPQCQSVQHITCICHVFSWCPYFLCKARLV